MNSSADENLEAMMGANMENIDAPSVSQANEHRTEVLNPPGVQYDMPSVSNHAYSNTNTSQPNTMEDPQGNNQAHTLSHLTNLMVCWLFSLCYFFFQTSLVIDLPMPSFNAIL